MSGPVKYLVSFPVSVPPSLGPFQVSWRGQRAFPSFNPAHTAFDAILNATTHANQGQRRLSPSN